MVAKGEYSIPANISLDATQSNGNGDNLSGEETPAQILSENWNFGSPYLPRTRLQSCAFYRKVRAMRLDPTIALGRLIAIAPLMLSEWSVEKKDDAPDGAQDLISEIFLPLRSHIIQTGYYGRMDFGWQGYEKVIDYVDGADRLIKLKPLLPDTTDILIETATGAFAGFAYCDIWKNQYSLDSAKCLLLNQNVEGANLYGQGFMACAEMPYDKWLQVEDAANRYDRKMAGAHWVIGYPLGNSEINGKTVDNFDVARHIGEALKASSTTVIPTTLSARIDSLNENSQTGEELWYIKLLADSGGQTTFIERQKYFDALKVRALGLPERSVLEGQFGTKAESEIHGDWAIMGAMVSHSDILQTVNWHAVNQVLNLNYGPDAENTVYLKPTPLMDADKEFLQDLYKTILASSIGAAEIPTIDLEAYKQKLGIPILPDADIDARGVIDPTEGRRLDDYEEDDTIPGDLIDYTRPESVSYSHDNNDSVLQLEFAPLIVNATGKPVSSESAGDEPNFVIDLEKDAYTATINASSFAKQVDNKGTKSKHRQTAAMFRQAKDMYIQAANEFNKAGDITRYLISQHNARQAASLVKHHSRIARALRK